jgi:hypothetical protein
MAFLPTGAAGDVHPKVGSANGMMASIAQPKRQADSEFECAISFPPDTRGRTYVGWWNVATTTVLEPIPPVDNRQKLVDGSAAYVATSAC